MRSPSLFALASALALLTCRSHERAGTEAIFTNCNSARSGALKLMFHGDRARLGLDPQEPELSPARVARGMISTWTSAPFDRFTVGGVDYAGRAYASPLYADGVRIASASGASGEALSVVFVATSNGDVYAIAASEAACTEGTLPAGAVLWKTHLATPGVPPRLDSGSAKPPAWPGIAVGTLATPVLDGAGALYVTAMDASDGRVPPRWKIYAIDIATGAVRSGWPVTFARDVVEAKNTNGPAYFDEDARYVSQRSALALSPAGDRLYVAFGGYWDEAVGWIVAVDTRSPKIVASFSGAADTLASPPGGAISRHANAGMWGAGGAAVDPQGRVYITTGNSPPEPAPSAHTWGNSMLRLTPDLALEGAYTPFDYCAMDKLDTDLAGSSPILLPPREGAATPNLIAVGGKAGVVYLLDGDGLGARGASSDRRPPCATSWTGAARDASLLPPDVAPPYCSGFGDDPCIEPASAGTCGRGPLWIFGPPGDDASIDHAKMRTTPAFFHADNGQAFVYVAGTTKARRCAPDTVPPSVVRLRVVADPGRPAYLARDAADGELAFVNPGSPVVTSNGGRDPVVWVVDQNARRTQALLDPTTPPPALYAVDGITMKPLWRSAPSDLEVGGKYVTVATAHGTVYAATDRLHAFTPAP